MGHPAPLDLGHRTYLDAKPEGESSMSEKARGDESVESFARRGPDGMVKPGLVESECPICKWPGQDGRTTPDAAWNALSPPGNASKTSSGRTPCNALRRQQGYL